LFLTTYGDVMIHLISRLRLTCELRRPHAHYSCYESQQTDDTHNGHGCLVESDKSSTEAHPESRGRCTEIHDEIEDGEHLSTGGPTAHFEGKGNARTPRAPAEDFVPCTPTF